MNAAFHTWMWAHPTLFTISVCGSFALFGIGLFAGLKWLIGNQYED